MSIENQVPKSTDKAPHAGNVDAPWGEKPVREFDTPLEEAVQKNYIRIPETDVKPEKKKKGPLVALAAGGAALLAAGGLYLGLNANSSNAQAPEKEPAVPAEPAAPEAPAPEAPVNEEPAAPEAPEAPEVDFGLPSLEVLRDMSPEERRAAATITVESVTVDGKIDWELYAQKLIAIQELNINAGSTDSEMAVLVESSEPAIDTTGALAASYNADFYPALGVEGTDINGFQGITGLHHGQLMAAYNAKLVGSDEPVATNFEYVSTEIANETPTSAYLTITHEWTDNFFSSGAFRMNPGGAAEMLQRSTPKDANEEISNNYNVAVQPDGTLKIESVSDAN